MLLAAGWDGLCMALTLQVVCMRSLKAVLRVRGAAEAGGRSHHDT